MPGKFTDRAGPYLAPPSHVVSAHSMPGIDAMNRLELVCWLWRCLPGTFTRLDRGGGWNGAVVVVNGRVGYDPVEPTGLVGLVRSEASGIRRSAHDQTPRRSTGRSTVGTIKSNAMYSPVAAQRGTPTPRATAVVPTVLPPAAAASSPRAEDAVAADASAQHPAILQKVGAGAPADLAARTFDELPGVARVPQCVAREVFAPPYAPARRPGRVGSVGSIARGS